MRGRKPKPTAQKRAEGNPGKRKLKDDEPRFDASLPDPPEPVRTDPVALGIWEQVAPELHATGVLTAVDGLALGAYCRAVARWIHAERKLQQFGAIIKGHRDKPTLSPFTREANEAVKQMQQLGSEFGLTPVSRSRIHAVATPEEDDPWAAYDQLTRASEMDIPEIDLTKTNPKGEA
ncbi:MAG: phage terminase small subunit P27 family [Pseudohongiellaceae bacterium]